MPPVFPHDDFPARLRGSLHRRIRSAVQGLARLSIARRLRISLVALALGMAVIGFAYWQTGRSAAAAAEAFDQQQRLSRQALRLGQQVADLRRVQTAYAASFSREDGARLRALRTQAVQTLTRLRQAPEAAALRREVDALAGAVGGFAAGTDLLDERIAELGHDPESGLQGALRKAVHQVERDLEASDEPRLLVSMLTLRRHEKDFILRGDQSYVDRHGDEALAFEFALAPSSIPADRKDAIRAAMSAYQAAFTGYAAGRFGLISELQSLDDIGARIEPAMTAFDRAQARALDAARAGLARRQLLMNLLFLATMLAVAGVLAASLLSVMRAVRAPIQDALQLARAIAEDRLDTAVAVRNPHDEVGALLTALETMRGNLKARTERERALANENARVRQALDSTRTGMLVTDADGLCVYANRAFEAVATAGGGPTPVGRPVATLHPGLAVADGEPRRVDFGGGHYEVVASPVLIDGTCIGRAYEWRDRALEVVIERDVAAIARAAAVGELDRRVETRGMEGFLRALGEGLNSLLDAVEGNVHQVQAVLGALAAGDFTRRIEGDARGVFARMQRDVAEAMEALGATMRSIQSSAASVQTAADEIASGSVDLSRRTEHQAEQLQGMQRELDRLVGTVAENAAGSRMAAESATGAVDRSQAGLGVMREVSSRMQSIRKASARMAEVVGVIDSIAFQTNLLALNAAVEAARAGTHGRGFAVVAGEVRSLAQKSAESSREIRSLIEQAQDAVRRGAEMVDEATRTSDDIARRIIEVNRTIGRIGEVSAAQEATIAGVARAVRDVDGSTAQNAALAEETSAATLSLAELSRTLGDSVAQFVLDASASAAAGPPATRRQRIAGEVC